MNHLYYVSQTHSNCVYFPFLLLFHSEHPLSLSYRPARAASFSLPLPMFLTISAQLLQAGCSAQHHIAQAPSNLSAPEQHLSCQWEFTGALRTLPSGT